MIGRGGGEDGAVIQVSHVHLIGPSDQRILISGKAIPTHKSLKFFSHDSHVVCDRKRGERFGY